MVESCINERDDPPISLYRACLDFLFFREVGIKPPEGAVVKSYGTECLGKDIPRVYQVMDTGVE